MGSIDWKWMIIGLLIGWMILPRLQGVFVSAHAGKAAA